MYDHIGEATTAPKGDRPPTKELKLTKPSIMELRSLTPVFGGRGDRRREETGRTSMIDRRPVR